MDEEFFLLRMRELIKEIYTKSLAHLVKMYEPYDLTPPQASILVILKNKKCVKVSELGTILQTADSNISAICRRLEERGLITRERDENDRRIVYIKPTPEAHHLFEKFEHERCESLKKMKHISEEDMITIVGALERLSEIIDQTSKH